MRAPDARWRKRLVLLSPLVVIALGHATARLAGVWLGTSWAWAPLALAYWAVLASLIAFCGGREAVGRWLRRPRGSRGWSVLVVAFGLAPLPVFAQNWQLLLSPAWLLLPWLLFALVNPWLEEGYWRGLLLDASAGRPGWLGVLYVSAAFALGHPLMWGVHSLAARDPAVLIFTLASGAVKAIAYIRTGSLRWAIFSHALVDLFNLNVVVLLNLYVPPNTAWG